MMMTEEIPEFLMEKMGEQQMEEDVAEYWFCEVN